VGRTRARPSARCSSHAAIAILASDTERGCSYPGMDRKTKLSPPVNDDTLPLDYWFDRQTGKIDLARLAEAVCTERPRPTFDEVPEWLAGKLPGNVSELRGGTLALTYAEGAARRAWFTHYDATNPAIIELKRRQAERKPD